MSDNHRLTLPKHTNSQAFAKLKGANSVDGNAETPLSDFQDSDENCDIVSPTSADLSTTKDLDYKQYRGDHL